MMTFSALCIFMSSRTLEDGETEAEFGVDKNNNTDSYGNPN